MARPSNYTDEIAGRLLSEIATTRKGLAAICKSYADFPTPSTVYRWMLANSEFRDRYARAKEDQMQVLEDELLEIADTPQVGEIVTIKPDGKEVKRADMIEHRKLRIEARKWLMGKLKPKKYGDKMAVTGADGGPLQIVSTIPRPTEE